jgi:conjugal transfer pilus assembly protein TraE
MKTPMLFRSLQAATAMVILVTLGLVIAVMVGGYAVTRAMEQRERIVLIPPYLDRQVQIGWSSASADYLKSFGMYFVTLAANVTPNNIDFVSQNLELFVDAKIFPDIRRTLKATAENPQFRDTGSSLIFQPLDIHFEPETMTVFVGGVAIHRDSAGRKTDTEMVYELGTEMRSGRPWINSIETYNGREMRTRQWKERNPNFREEASQ